MADTSTVCSMCGDVGFPDKIFRCIRCRSRLQHSYCSNYYEAEEAMETAEVCDWCLSAERRHAGPSKKADSSSPRKRPESYPSSSSSSSRVKRGGDREDSGPRGKSSSSSSKPGGRRYKLLKDVLC